jgi:hypothetical protein
MTETANAPETSVDLYHGTTQKTVVFKISVYSYSSNAALVLAGAPPSSSTDLSFFSFPACARP